MDRNQQIKLVEKKVCEIKTGEEACLLDHVWVGISHQINVTLSFRNVKLIRMLDREGFRLGVRLGAFAVERLMVRGKGLRLSQIEQPSVAKGAGEIGYVFVFDKGF